MPNLADLLGQLSPFAKLTMVVAIVAFGLAVAYVFRPTEQKLLLMRPVSLAAIFATISGLLGGWIAVLGGVARRMTITRGAGARRQPQASRRRRAGRTRRSRR